LGCELQCLVKIAFGLTYQGISGGAGWTEQVKYDVEALPPKTAAIRTLRSGIYSIADEQLRLMLQSLLATRFHLQYHKATREADVYILSHGGGALALRSTDAGVSTEQVRILWSKRKWALEAITMTEFAEYLSSHVFGVPVFDRTGLGGRFDYTPEAADPFAPDPRVDLVSSAISFIQELHLKLQRTKAPVESFVIDHAEKPLPN
jgi:uncharacterized protein (TIGR03435 family)